MRATKSTSPSKLRKLSSLSSKILSGLLAIAFSVCLSIGLIGRIFLGVGLDRDLYLTLIEDTRLVSRSRGLLANLLVTYALQSEGADSFLADHGMGVWESVADAVIEHEWLRANVDHVAGEFLLWFNEAERPMPEITIELGPINSVLRSPQGALAILPLLQSAPACPGDVSEVTIMSGGLIDCVPEGIDLALVGTTISERIADYMPTEITLKDLTSSQMIRSSTIERVERLRLQVQVARGAAALMIRIAILSISLYGLLNSDSGIRLLHSLRLPLYMAPALTLILLAAAFGVLQFGLPYLASSGFQAVSSDIQALVLDLARRLGGAILAEWAKLGMVMLGSVVALHIVSAIILRSIGKPQKVDEDLGIRRSRIKKEFR